MSDLSDEEMRKLLKPICTIEQVESAVQKSFGSDIKVVKALDSYDDQNFLAVRDNVSFLVKIHNGWESRNFCDAFEACGRSYEDCSSVIHLQTSIMDHLSVNGIPTSKAELCDDLPLSIHSLPVQSDSHSPCKLVVKLMTWVYGRPMSSLSQLPLECLYSAGRFLGTMRQALDKMDVSRHAEAAQRFHAWDGKQTCHIQHFVWAIDDPSKRSMVQSILSSFRSRILDSGIDKQFDVGIIQGDFNDANIIVDDNFSIAGVIDFGDSLERYVTMLSNEPGFV
jgi:Ser/Thr protein kinase RdoA (MazF antagonist)